MTDAIWTNLQNVSRPARAETIPLPSPRPFDAPVFIQDCVTPIAGETLLSLLMKRMAQDDQP